MAGDGYSVISCDNLATSAGSVAPPVSTSKNGVDIQSSVTDEFCATTTTTGFVVSRIPSPPCAGDTDSRTRMEDHHSANKEMAMIPNLSLIHI